LADAALARAIGPEEHRYRGKAKLPRIAPGLEVLDLKAVQHNHASFTRTGNSID
jgi:hypothetical protein